MFGVIYSANRQNDKRDAVFDEKLLQIGEKITELKKAQDKHNGVIERTFILEKGQEAQSRDIKTLYHNLEEMKQDSKEIKSEVSKLTVDVHDLQK